VKSLRGPILSWLGIVGGAITIFGNLEALVDMAEWARWIVSRWHDLISKFWLGLFLRLHWRLNPALVPYFTLGAALILIAIGARLTTSAERRNKHDWSFWREAAFGFPPVIVLYLLILGPKQLLLTQLFLLPIPDTIGGLSLWERYIAILAVVVGGFVSSRITTAHDLFSRIWIMLLFVGFIVLLNEVSTLGINIKPPTS
jgi:hypothetical protein